MGIIQSIIDGIFNCGNKKKTSRSTSSVQRYTSTFKGEAQWEAAAGEYRRLTGKSEEAELTEEENKKILDFTMTPLAYFFGWLCERDFIGEGFVSEFGETDKVKIPDEVKNGKITPLEALAGLDHYFSYEWIKEEAQYFFRFYFDDRAAVTDRFTDQDTYLYDYYECIGEPEDRYYCIDYSSEVQKKISQRLDERYEKLSGKQVSWEYLRDNYYQDDEEFEHAMKIYSTFFDKDLRVFRCGRILKGEFPEDYAQKCLKSLEEMPQKEWHRLERWLVECYGGEPEQFKMNYFEAFDIYIYEPQEEGDLAFMISGEAEYEEEHGISFTIRNGILLDWSYALESRDPYDEALIARYERCSYGRDPKTGTWEIDFEQIKEQKEQDALVAEGKLIRTLLVPEWLGGADTDENTVCVTPLTLAQLEKINKRLKMIRAYAATVYPDREFHVDVKPEYCENTEGTKVLIPMSIIYSVYWPEKKFSVSMAANILE